MADTIQPAPAPAPAPRSFMTDMPAATVSAGMTLLSRRSAAIADFWRSCAEVRQPTELMAVQLNYWTQLVDDYQEALSQGFAQMAGAASEPTPAAKVQGRSAAQSA
jgi:hypothetical protein